MEIKDHEASPVTAKLLKKWVLWNIFCQASIHR